MRMSIKMNCGDLLDVVNGIKVIVFYEMMLYCSVRVFHKAVLWLYDVKCLVS